MFLIYRLLKTKAVLGAILATSAAGAGLGVASQLDSAEAQVQNSDQCVILLHGLTRSPFSMRKLEKSLSAEGYRVVNHGYPSTEEPIEVLADTALPKAIVDCGDDVQTIHVVTHSLGGILLRQYVAHHDFPKLGRAVMLGPPNQGSEIPDVMGDLPGFDWLNGPAGAQLGTGEHSLPKSLGPATFEVGIIAGTQTINPILSSQIPGVDDGKVSVERTKLDGMKDHVTMPVSHPFLMQDEDVIEQVSLFLKTGAFDDSAQTEWLDHPEAMSQAQ